MYAQDWWARGEISLKIIFSRSGRYDNVAKTNINKIKVVLTYINLIF